MTHRYPKAGFSKFRGLFAKRFLSLSGSGRLIRLVRQFSSAPMVFILKTKVNKKQKQNKKKKKKEEKELSRCTYVSFQFATTRAVHERYHAFVLQSMHECRPRPALSACRSNSCCTGHCSVFVQDYFLPTSQACILDLKLIWWKGHALVTMD